LNGPSGGQYFTGKSSRERAQQSNQGKQDVGRGEGGAIWNQSANSRSIMHRNAGEGNGLEGRYVQKKKGGVWKKADSQSGPAGEDSCFSRNSTGGGRSCLRKDGMKKKRERRRWDRGDQWARLLLACWEVPGKSWNTFERAHK